MPIFQRCQRAHHDNPLQLGFGLIIASLAILTAPLLAAKPPEKPNLIYIMADDLGYGDLGCFGQERIATPHLDRLAAEGRRFTNFYAGNTVCRPSRLSLWTGLHMGHTPIASNTQYHFQPADITVAERLKQAGYATGGVGKWAMGGVGTTGHPNRNGFDFWMGYLDQGRAHNYYPTYLWLNERQIPLPGNVLMGDTGEMAYVAKLEHRQTYSHDVITDHAFRFIREHAGRPFLLHIHWTIPHTNNQGGRVTGDGQEVPDHGIYANEDWPHPEKGFAAMITRMDRDVGRLVDLLRELGIDRRTLVIFTSDNGPHNEGGHKHTYFDSNGPLRGFKRDLYEGGIRVPMIAWWPGAIEPGTTSNHPSAFWDWMPTACELAQTPTPETNDGISFVPALLGDDDQQPAHDYLYWQFRGKQAVRAGRWKAVQPGPDAPVELYDLTDDIGETNDLAAQHPDIVNRLKGCMRQAKDEPAH